MSWASFIQSVTPTTVIVLMAAGIILALGKGWIFTAFQIRTLLDQANQRAEDYKALWESEREMRIALAASVEKLTVTAEASLRILSALPQPSEFGTTQEKVT